jgi:hypothetical protein
VELAVVMLTTLFSNALGIRLTSTTADGGAYGDEIATLARFTNGRSGRA